VPDIAADGDTDSGLLTGYIASGTSSHPGPYQTQVNAGTSLATPVIAGLVADAQQGQKSDFGFINQLLYRLAGTRAFHDSQEHAYTTQVSAKGYGHDDRHRHAQRCRFHRRAARRRSLLG
jgi:hypothetical protein